MKPNTLCIVLLAASTLSACTQSQLDRLAYVGQEPPLAEVSIPRDKIRQPVQWPAPKGLSSDVATVNSLWKVGSKSFFGDQRARAVGDILKVHVEIKDKAELDNSTKRKRGEENDLAIPSLFGLKNKLDRFIPGNFAGTSPLLDLTSSMDNSGEGTIEREETIETEIAAVIIQELPNGNLVIYGRQEIRVNYEVRQLAIRGVVNPRDISTDNTIDLSRIAEARVSYGGKGLISDLQQPRVGTQIIDILSPW